MGRLMACVGAEKERRLVTKNNQWRALIEGIIPSIPLFDDNSSGDGFVPRPQREELLCVVINSTAYSHKIQYIQTDRMYLP